MPISLKWFHCSFYIDRYIYADKRYSLSSIRPCPFSHVFIRPQSKGIYLKQVYNLDILLPCMVLASILSISRSPQQIYNHSYKNFESCRQFTLKHISDSLLVRTAVR